MTDLTILTNVTSASLSGDAATLNTSTESVSVTTGNAGVIEVQAVTKTRYLGTAFSGSSGATGRALTHSETITADAIISLSGRFLDSSEYSLSTTTLTNDTITVSTPIYDDDIVVIWV